MSIDEMFDGGLCPETRLEMQRRQERPEYEVFISEGRIEDLSLEVSRSYDNVHPYSTVRDDSKPQEFLSMALYKL